MLSLSVQVIEKLSRAGADIHELNSVRTAISQTKGGRLAEAAKPAKVQRERGRGRKKGGGEGEGEGVQEDV